jgi:hypothetical protein
LPARVRTIHARSEGSSSVVRVHPLISCLYRSSSFHLRSLPSSTSTLAAHEKHFVHAYHALQTQISHLITFAILALPCPLTIATMSSADTPITYSGNCHCGLIKFTVKLLEALAPAGTGKINSCNCSICTKNGTIISFSCPKSSQLADYFFLDQITPVSSHPRRPLTNAFARLPPRLPLSLRRYLPQRQRGLSLHLHFRTICAQAQVLSQMLQ